MHQTTATQPKRKTVADYKAVVAHLLTEMDRLEERMDNNRTEIERLKIETEVIKTRTRANLSQLQVQIDNLSRGV